MVMSVAKNIFMSGGNKSPSFRIASWVVPLTILALYEYYQRSKPTIEKIEIKKE